MLRSVRIDVIEPFLADGVVDLVTWGSSFSSLAAGRRWSLSGDAGGTIEVDSTWIHLGPDARPARIGQGFDGYAEAAQGRVASTKLTLAAPPTDGGRSAWQLRATDVDRMGHVNNAAYWAAVEHRLLEREPDLRRPHRARLDYRHPIDLGERVELAEDVRHGRYGAAFVVGDAVKAVVWVEPLPLKPSLTHRRYPRRMNDEKRMSRRVSLASLGGLVAGAAGRRGLASGWMRPVRVLPESRRAS